LQRVSDTETPDTKTTRLLAGAVQQRWALTREQRGEVITSLLQVMNDAEASPRDKASAARALISAEKQNAEDEHAAAKAIAAEAKPAGNRFLIVAQQLGIDLGAERVSTERAASNLEATERAAEPE
jgi:hypothetical protein